MNHAVISSDTDLRGAQFKDADVRDMQVPNIDHLTLVQR